MAFTLFQLFSAFEERQLFRRHIRGRSCLWVSALALPAVLHVDATKTPDFHAVTLCRGSRHFVKEDIRNLLGSCCRKTALFPKAFDKLRVVPAIIRRQKSLNTDMQKA